MKNFFLQYCLDNKFQQNNAQIKSLELLTNFIRPDLSKNIILVDKDTYACLTNVNKDEINSLINGIILEKGNKDFLKYVHKTIK